MQVMTNYAVLQKLQQDLGFGRIILQHGQGPAPVVDTTTTTLQVETYDFKASLAVDLARADWVIGHAGAGTISETLQLQQQDNNKRLIVVINDALMDNHQTELAYAMRNRHYLQVVDDPQSLLDMSVWNALNTFEPTPFPGGNTMDFPRLLTAFLQD